MRAKSIHRGKRATRPGAAGRRPVESFKAALPMMGAAACGEAALPGTESLEELRARGVLVLTKTQMAAAFQVSYRTISEMMRRGELPYFRIGARRPRFRVEDALAALSASPTRHGEPNTPRPAVTSGRLQSRSQSQFQSQPEPQTKTNQQEKKT